MIDDKNIYKVTHDEYMVLAESNPNDRYEYIDGYVYLQASPTPLHQRVSINLSNILYNYFNNKRCEVFTAPFDITLKEENGINIVQPDLVVICDSDKLTDEKYTGVPSLVIEITSPSNSSYDYIKKLDLYRRVGIEEYVIANPNTKKLTYYRFKEKDIYDMDVFSIHDKLICASNRFEGLKIELNTIFN